VSHFFKVGEPRSQAKAMVFSLACQMAEIMPGMAAKLEGVTRSLKEDVGRSMALSPKDLFEA
jgi:hypothetical protein